MAGDAEQVNGTGPIGQRAPETTELIRYLRMQPVGTLVSYNTISAKLRVSAQGEGRGKLHTAINALWHDDHDPHFWRVEREQGITRITGEDALGLAEHSRQSIRRKARRSARRLAHLPVESFSAPDKARHAMEMFVCAAVAELNTASNVERILAAPATMDAKQLLAPFVKA